MIFRNHENYVTLKLYFRCIVFNVYIYKLNCWRRQYLKLMSTDEVQNEPCIFFSAYNINKAWFHSSGNFLFACNLIGGSRQAVCACDSKLQLMCTTSALFSTSPFTSHWDFYYYSTVVCEYVCYIFTLKRLGQFIWN